MKISETIRYRIKEAGADFRCNNISDYIEEGEMEII